MAFNGLHELHPQQPWGSTQHGTILPPWAAGRLACLGFVSLFSLSGPLLWQPPISPMGLISTCVQTIPKAVSRGDLSPGSHSSYLIHHQLPILVYKNRIYNHPHPPGSIPVNEMTFSPQPCHFGSNSLFSPLTSYNQFFRSVDVPWPLSPPLHLCSARKGTSILSSRLL